MRTVISRFGKCRSASTIEAAKGDAVNPCVTYNRPLCQAKRFDSLPRRQKGRLPFADADCLPVDRAHRQHLPLRTSRTAKSERRRALTSTRTRLRSVYPRIRAGS
jgi:hypothetical protein